MSDEEIIIQRPLSELEFSDLQLRLDQRGGTFFQGKAKGTTQAPLNPVPVEFADSIADLRDALNHVDKAAGSLVFEGLQIRYQKMTGQSTDGMESIYAVIRRLEERAMRIHDLGVRPEALKAMLSWRHLQSGLIIIAGATGQGKTTLGKHLFKEYMIEGGGRGISIEDPIEYLMQGRMGEHGFCIQHEAEDEDWSDTIKACLRMRPSYLYIGELRSPLAALEAIKASATGHIVITTTHAGSMDEAVGRVAQLAAGAPDSGGMDYIRGEIAKSLVGLVVTRLSGYGPDLKLLYGETESERSEIGRLIEDGKDSAFAKGGWTRDFDANRRTADGRHAKT